MVLPRGRGAVIKAVLGVRTQGEVMEGSSMWETFQQSTANALFEQSSPIIPMRGYFRVEEKFGACSFLFKL
jgi:hypothetical protein